MTRKILIAAMALDIGGAETHIATLVRELRRRGNDVLVVSAGGVYAAEIEACGAKHITAPLNRRSLPAMLRGLLILRREARRFRPNIVHAHARIPAFLCGILKKLGGKFAFVTTAHGVFEVTRATRLLSDWGSRTLAVSDDVREYLTANYDLPPDDIRLTVNGIDTERFSPDTDGSAVRRELGIPPDAPVALTVSRLDESAGDPAAKLAEAAPELSRAIPGLRVVIAGGGVLDSAREARLRLRVPELNALCGYDCVILAGARDDIPELLAAADVFVGVSRAALEALAAGKPVILAGGQGCGGVLDETSLPDALATNFTFRGTPLAETEDLVRDVSELWNGSGFTNRAGFGRALVLERYSVTRTADDAEAAYGEAAAAGVSAAMCGYYGYGNAGDDEIMRCVRRAAYDAGMRKITVLSRAPRSTEREFGFRARSRFNPFSLFWTLLRSDLLIFGGGSLLQDATSTRSLVYYCSVLRLARLCGAKTVIYANGVGPLTREANRRRVLREVSRAAVVTLRDKASEAELISLGVAPEKLTVTADPAFADAPRQSAEEPEAVFAVTARRSTPEFYGKLAAFCDAAGKTLGLRAVFVPMQLPSDAEACSEVINRSVGQSTFPLNVPAQRRADSAAPNTPDAVFETLARARFVVSMRLHTLIFAVCAGVPCAGIDVDPKVAALCSELGLPNLGTPEEFDAAAALRAVTELNDRRGEYAERVRAQARALAVRAERDREMLRQLTIDY